MSEETTQVPPGMEPAAGGTGTPAPVAEPAHDKGDYTARVRNEPDFAAQEVSRLTGELAKAKESSQVAETFVSMAKTVGNGDASRGLPILEEAIRNQARIQQDPKAAKAFNQWLNGGDFPEGGAEDTGANEDPFAEDIANSSVVRELRQELAAVKGQTAQQLAQANLRDFFSNTEEGRVLNEEEQGQVLNEIQGSIQRAQQSGQTQYLDNLSSETIRTVVASWMSREGKLGEIGERIAVARAEAKQAASTGEPPSPIGTGLDTAPQYSDNLAEAVAQFAKEQGVDLYNPKVR